MIEISFRETFRVLVREDGDRGDMLLLRLGEDSVPLEFGSLEIVGVRLVSTSKDGCVLGFPTREDLLVFSSKLGDLLGVVLLESNLGRDEIRLTTCHRPEFAGEVVVLILSGEKLGTESVELGRDVEGLRIGKGRMSAPSFASTSEEERRSNSPDLWRV